MPARRYFIFAGVVLAVVVLLNLPPGVEARFKGGVRDNLAPFQSGPAALAARVRQLVAGLRDAAAGGALERARQTEIAHLRQELWRLRQLGLENSELRRQLGFARLQPRTLTLCEVVSRGGSTGWWQTVRVNRGRDHGVQPGQAVITADGLVGRTTDVSHRTADVLLLTDPNCRVACRFLGTTATGIVRGTGAAGGRDAELEMLYTVQPFRMDFIPSDAQVVEGSEVVTSGLGGVFPEGLPVGRVVNVAPGPSGLYQRATVAPSADLGMLHYLFVVQAAAEAAPRRPAAAPPEAEAEGASPPGPEEAP